MLSVENHNHLIVIVLVEFYLYGKESIIKVLA